jgi:hypothetical protein
MVHNMVGVAAMFSVPDRSVNPFRVRAASSIIYGRMERSGERNRNDTGGNWFCALAVLAAPEKIETYSRYLHAQNVFILNEKRMYEFFILG